MKIVYAPRALRDLGQIASYLEERSPAGKRSVLAAIKSSVEALKEAPDLGRTVDEAGHRRLIVPRYAYAVFYRAAADEVFILHIRHTARRPVDPHEEL